jgi:hypothetical protein
VAEPSRLRISIAMATYNGARFLPEQLASFVAQERLPDEFVVCDDGSSDATMDILHAFAITAPFEVRVERNEKNLGYVRNFEKALSLCTGDIIFLSDQDDVWLPAKLGRVEAEFLADPMVMATINDMFITDAELKHNNVTQMGNILRAGMDDTSFGWGCGLAVRKSLMTLLLPFPSQMRFAHDSWINEVSTALGAKKVVTESLQLYRRHGLNESHSSLSVPSPVTARTVMAQVDLSSPLSGWDVHLEITEAARSLLINRQPNIEALGLVEKAKHGLAILDRRQNAIRTRVALLKTPRLKRLPGVLSFWAAGHYRRFSGWKSAVKDMIRP